jgi:hypothetical protein
MIALDNFSIKLLQKSTSPLEWRWLTAPIRSSLPASSTPIVMDGRLSSKPWAQTPLWAITLFRYSALVAQPLFTPEDLYLSQKVGIFEALNAGTTTILNHAHYTWTPENALAGYSASVDSARVFFAYTFQNVTTNNFTIPEQLQQWRQLNAKHTSNITSLVMSYDDFTVNPYGNNTKDMINLAK